MNKSRFVKNLLFTIFWGLLSISFIFFASLIILKANGFKLNWRTWKIAKTGMINLSGHPEDVQIKVNSKQYYGLPKKISELEPKTYNIEVSKPSYSSWQKQVKIEPGKTTSFESVILFKTEPEEVNPPQSYSLEQFQQDFRESSKDLKVTGSEVFYQDKLVTRFGTNISSAVLYPDKNHLVFLSGNEIRVIDLDGSNNRLLVSLNPAGTTPIVFQNNGSIILYLEAGKLKAKVIR